VSARNDGTRRRLGAESTAFASRRVPMKSLPFDRRGWRAALAAVSLSMGLLSTPVAQAQDGHWVAAWAAVPQSVSDNPAAPSFDRAPRIDGRTVRQIVYPSLSGRRLRLQISNRYGRQALTIDAARVADAGAHASIAATSDRSVTVGGQARIVVAAGATVWSDPIELPVQAGQPLAVSFYLAGDAAPSTWHKLASQVNFISEPGNHAADAEGTAFSARYTSYLWLSGLDVETVPQAYAVVAIGDSITDGMRSSLDANRRWPDGLARALAGRDVAVVNAGISGNRLLSDSPCYGERLLARFAPDALAQDGVKTVIVLIGINDINFAAMPPHAGLDCDNPHTPVDAAALEAGYRQLAAAAHAHGLRVIGATLTPASLPPTREAIRNAVNAWMRNGGTFDAVIDFDAVLRDPRDPRRLLPLYDSDDHIHPSDAGYAAMAAHVPLEWLAPR
jgi:lysophospholipase L1-like esterase